MRDSTKQTRKKILDSATEVFLEYGYEGASMRQIAAKAEITAGAIYKHFSSKEEMFQAIFEDCGGQLMSLTESMITDDFSQLGNQELLSIFYSRISIQTFQVLEKNFKLYHMLIKHGSRNYFNQLQNIYVERCSRFAKGYYDELLSRGLSKRSLSYEEVKMLSMSEFVSICMLIGNDACENGIPKNWRQALIKSFDIMQKGLIAELGILEDREV